MAWANDLWRWITENFNNREIASAGWLLALLFLALIKKQIRDALGGLIRAAFQPKLIAVFLLFAGNVACLTWVIQKLDAWTVSQLPATIIWYFLSGLSLLGRSFQAKEDANQFAQYAKDTIGITAALEFLYVVHTFSLFVEVILTPIVTVIGLMYAYSELDRKHAPVKNVLEWVIIFIVGIFIWHSISGIIDDPEKFLTVGTARSFVLPILMTVGSIPFFYVVHCYSQFEIASVRLGFKDFQSDELKRYAKRRFLWLFAFRPWLLLRAARQFQSLPANTKSDVDKIAEDIIRYEREAKNPPQVDERHGWSPYAAREFLSAHGLRASDYHEIYGGGEWWASSHPQKLDDQILYNSATYYIKGNERLVKTLKLKGDFCYEFSPEHGVDRFRDIAMALLIKSETADTPQLREKLNSGEAFEASVGRNIVRLAIEPYPSGTGFDLTFEIRNQITN
tara:strand:- start:5061 stop:6413 length:1353 start_codon:yes stop_codon:yes gene_type:complete